MTMRPGQIGIPALYMRGGTSKGTFFRRQDLPGEARDPGPVRDAVLLRVRPAGPACHTGLTSCFDTLTLPVREAA